VNTYVRHSRMFKSLLLFATAHFHATGRYAYIHVCGFIHICIYVYIYVCICVYIYIHTHTHYIYIYIHILHIHIMYIVAFSQQCIYTG